MQNKKLILGSLVVIIAIFVSLTFLYKSEKQTEIVSSVSNINELLVRDYSMKHGENKKNIYVVEFLDPECESCALFSPVVRKLYKEYHEDIQIVIKYLANHKNSEFA
ncbi:DsbA family protein, partial [Aliarcobacter butzleri]|nr:DsbA family protein [Aliarcobacter butzleri]